MFFLVTSKHHEVGPKSHQRCREHASLCRRTSVCRRGGAGPPLSHFLLGQMALSVLSGSGHPRESLAFSALWITVRHGLQAPRKGPQVWRVRVLGETEVAGFTPVRCWVLGVLPAIHEEAPAALPHTFPWKRELVLLAEKTSTGKGR